MDRTKPTALGRGVAQARGQTTELRLADGRQIQVQAVLVDVEELTPSHNALTFQRLPGYPDVIQERRYHADDGAQNHVDRIAANLEPELVLRIGLRAIDGPPVIRPDGIVIGGNGRTMGLQRAWDRYSRSWKRYRQAFPRYAAPLFGGSLGEPGDSTVLALEVQAADSILEDGTALADLAAALNDVPTKDRDSLGEARTRARRFRRDEDLVEWFQRAFPSDQTVRSFLRSEPGRAFFRRLVGRGVWLQTEVSSMMDKHGGLTDAAIEAVERMLYAAAVQDPDVVERAPDSALRRLEHGIPAIIKASPFEEWDVREELAEALDLLAGVRSTGAGGIDDFLEQRDLLDRRFGDRAEAVARLIDSDRLRKSDLRERFQTYGQLALEANQQSNYVQMFDWDPPQPGECFRAFLTPEGSGEVPRSRPDVPTPEIVENAPDRLVDLVEAFLDAEEQVALELETDPEMPDSTRTGKKIWVSRTRNRCRRYAENNGIPGDHLEEIVDALREKRGQEEPEELKA